MGQPTCPVGSMLLAAPMSINYRLNQKNPRGNRALRESDMKRATSIEWIVLLFALLPAWAVKSASSQNRISWIGMLVFLAFVSLVITAARARKSEPQVTFGPYVLRNFPYVGAVVGVSFLIAGFFATAITYATPGIGLMGELGLTLSQRAAILLPVVARYATAMNPPLSTEALFRVQSIVSVFMLAGIPSFVAYVIYLVRMPKAERLKIYESKQVKRHSRGFVLFGAFFAIYVALASYIGFFEFERPEAKWCILQANCYARGDDLTIFAAALLKVCGFFGFPLGAFVLVDASRLLPPP